MEGRTLVPDQEDALRWNWSSSGSYSAQSAYLHFFVGRPTSPTWSQIWRCWTPLKCRIWVWLAAANRCWTADRLERRHLPFNALCPLCDQDPETLRHLLLDFPFSKSVLHEVFSKAGALRCLPRPSEDLPEWLSKGTLRLRGKVKAVRLLINLSLWRIWQLWNDCVFEDARPVAARLAEDILGEADLWRAAGARALERLPLHSRPPD